MPNREQFVRDAYQQAREAGLSDAQARLAASQAALETGFGKSVVGNNYFGIKAGKSWAGPVTNAGTWEEVNGNRVNTRANFRSYSNPADSFRDWATTVGSKWKDALTANSFTDAVAGLRYGQPGGYATDSRYGSKLRSIDRRYGPKEEELGIMEATSIPTPDPRPVDPSVQSPFQALLGEDPAYTSTAAAYSPEPETNMAQTSVPVRSVKTTSYTQQAPLSELRQPQMSLADQYASYGAGRQPTELAGILSQDVAQQRMIDQLNAQKQQLAAGVNPMDTQPEWKPPADLAQPQIQQPVQVQPVQAPEVTSYQAPPQQQPQQGLLSPDERAMYEQQYSLLGQQPLNSNTKQKISQGLKNGLGTFGGALAGGLLGGPVGGLLGGFLGNRIVGRGLLSAYPKAPESRSRGDGSLTDYGREVRGESRQFNDAVSSGAVGLW